MNNEAAIVVLCFLGLAGIGVVVLLAYAIAALSALMDPPEDWGSE